MKSHTAWKVSKSGVFSGAYFLYLYWIQENSNSNFCQQQSPRNNIISLKSTNISTVHNYFLMLAWSLSLWVKVYTTSLVPGLEGFFGTNPFEYSVSATWKCEFGNI